MKMNQIILPAEHSFRVTSMPSTRRLLKIVITAWLLSGWAILHVASEIELDGFYYGLASNTLTMFGRFSLISSSVVHTLSSLCNGIMRELVMLSLVVGPPAAVVSTVALAAVALHNSFKRPIEDDPSSADSN